MSRFLQSMVGMWWCHFYGAAFITSPSTTLSLAFDRGMNDAIRLLLFVAAFRVQSTDAVIRLPKFVTDGLVLQTNAQSGVRSFLSGWADPNETVTVNAPRGPYTAIAGLDGSWSLQLDPIEVGHCCCCFLAPSSLKSDLIAAVCGMVGISQQPAFHNHCHWLHQRKQRDHGQECSFWRSFLVCWWSRNV